MNTKTIDEYLKLPYTIEMVRDDDPDNPGWVARVTELPGCITQADSFEETGGMIVDAMRVWIATAIADGIPVPEPLPAPSYSGKFVVRVPRSLHRQLAEAAGDEQVSLNQYINVALAGSVAGRGIQPVIREMQAGYKTTPAATHFLSPELSALDLDIFMRAALEQAAAAGAAGEWPIGAVVVIDGEIVARGRARHRELGSQVRHAELNAILEGGERLFRHYDRAILFTTVEPCPMCLGAAVMADIPHIIFALHDRAVQSGQTVTANPYVHRHIRSYFGGVLAAESAAIFAQYDPQTLKYIQTGHA